jgi:MraZ protein
MFTGSTALSLDPKGRMSIPTKHRETLAGEFGGQLTLTRHPHGCLMLFPRATWVAHRQKIAALPMSARWFQRILLGHADDLEMDSTGRILISPELRGHANLGKDIVMMGMDSHFEIWDVATYQAKEVEEQAADQSDALKNFVF